MTPAPTDQTTEKATDQAWPDGVTARILTRTGRLFNEMNATVDIHDEPAGTNARSTARCRPCGWTKDHGLTYRHQVLEWAQQHADRCTALAQPTT